MDDPGGRRLASLLPVVIDSAAPLITLTMPSLAIDFSLTGVFCFTDSRISMRVGSAVAGRTAVTLPTLIPHARNSVSGSGSGSYRGDLSRWDSRRPARTHTDSPGKAENDVSVRGAESK